MPAGPDDLGLGADREQKVELFGEQLVVIFQVVAEQRKGFDERTAPAMISARPPERRSRVANC
jgi:hypothetical protein